MLDRTTSSTPARVDDHDAVEIGQLYRKAKHSLIESVRHQLECGRRLQAKKEQLGHRNWLPWLESNADTLGFKSRQTASRMIAAWSGWRQRYASDDEANGALTHHLPTLDLAQISRETWGNDEVAAGNPQPPAPRPTIDPTIAILIDAALQIAGSDVVTRYINGLEDDPNTVSRQQFKQAARAVEQELPAR